MNHVGGFGVAARAFSAGCGLAVFIESWNVLRFKKWLETESVTHVSLVPTQLHDLVRDSCSAPASLKAVIVGGGRLDDTLGQAARDVGWPVLASYGMTEASSQIATQDPELLHLPYSESPLRVLPIWDVRASNGGLLEIRGDALFSGKLEKRNGEWDFLARKKGWFLTNDRANVIDGSVMPAGRADSLVKIMGELVDLDLVERSFLKIAAGRIPASGVSVIAVPDARREQLLVLVSDQSAADINECYEDYQRVAPGLERFDRLVKIDTLPRTALGKLKKNALLKILGFNDV